MPDAHLRLVRRRSRPRNAPPPSSEELRQYLKPHELDELDALLARGPLKLRTYLSLIWPIIEPDTPFVGGWHIDAICDHLEAVTLSLLGQPGGIRDLLVNVMPRSTKTITASVAWPSWSWTRNPSLRFLCSSYSADLALQSAVDARRVIESPWYRARWGDRFHLTSDQNVKGYYENDRRGYRISTSTGGTVLGRGGDVLLSDDPHNLKYIHSEAVREEELRWYRGVWSTRRNDPKKSCRVMIGQRGHQQDISAFCIEMGYTHLCLPNEYEPTRMVMVGGVPAEKSVKELATPIGFVDPRSEPGELMCPGRLDRKETDGLKITMGMYDAAAQLQQRPAPLEGGIFKRKWWQLYTVLPEKFDEELISMDCSFTDTDQSDFVCIQAWGRLGADRYLKDQVKDRMSFSKACQELAAMCSRHPRARRKLVEKSANGPAIINALEKKITGLIGVPARGSKVARAYAAEPEVEAGNVHVPGGAPWIEDFLHEHTVFPNGANDDQVDTTTQALNWFTSRSRGRVASG